MSVILDYRQYSQTVRLAIFPARGMGGCLGQLVFDRATYVELDNWDRDAFPTCLSVSLLSPTNACLQGWYYYSPVRDRNHLVNCVAGPCKGDVQMWQRMRKSIAEHMVALDSGLTPITLSVTGFPGQIVVQPSQTPLYARCGGLFEASFTIGLPDDLRFIAAHGVLRYGG